MNEQQSVNNTFINNQSQINSQLNRKQFEKLKKSKKSLLVAGIFAIIWFICFVIFIILLNVAIASSTDVWIRELSNSANVSTIPPFTSASTWAVALAFICIGAFMVLGCVVFGIIALVKIFSISKEVDKSSNNVDYNNISYNSYDIRTSLSTTKFLGLLGIILCPIYIGIILLWVSNVRLSQLIKRVSPIIK